MTGRAAIVQKVDTLQRPRVPVVLTFASITPNLLPVLWMLKHVQSWPGEYAAANNRITCNKCRFYATTASSGSMAESDCICNAGNRLACIFILPHETLSRIKHSILVCWLCPDKTFSVHSLPKVYQLHRGRLLSGY